MGKVPLILLTSALLAASIMACSLPEFKIPGCIVLKQSGVYMLVRDVLDRRGTCMQVIADNVVLDCQGHVIKGVGGGYGVYVEGARNVTIRNCILRNWGIGIHLKYVLNGTLENNVIFNSTGDGISLIYSAYVVLRNNTVSYSRRKGIVLMSSFYNTLKGNMINSTGCGIWLEYGSGNTLRGNVVLNATGNGIRLMYSVENILKYNKVRHSKREGIYLYLSSDNIISKNVVCGSGIWDIYFDARSNGNRGDNTCSTIISEGINSVKCSKECQTSLAKT